MTDGELRTRSHRGDHEKHYMHLPGTHFISIEIVQRRTRNDSHNYITPRCGQTLEFAKRIKIQYQQNIIIFNEHYGQFSSYDGQPRVFSGFWKLFMIKNIILNPKV